MISAKIIADSINSYTGTRLITYELEYPRFIHAELMTHKMLGKNAQSSRAVPVASTLEVNKEFVRPIVWGKNKAGMASAELLEGNNLRDAMMIWDTAAKQAFIDSNLLAGAGLHKQWANRITEPFSHIKVIVTGTEWDNFFWLRLDEECVQPELFNLATKMKLAMQDSVPRVLADGDWHLPYVGWHRDKNEKQVFLTEDIDVLTTEEALKISASCCAQVSYRKLNDSKEKAIEIFDKLFSGPKPHMSPTEHQGMVFEPAEMIHYRKYWPIGMTHMDRDGNYWSANLKDFIQYRQMIQQKSLVN